MKMIRDMIYSISFNIMQNVGECERKRRNTDIY